MKRFILLAAAAVVLLALGGAACAQPSGERTVRGVLLDVRPATLGPPQEVTLRDDAGRLYTFRVAPDATSHGGPISAGHLRQHMALGEQVTVRYREGADGLVALQIED